MGLMWFRSKRIIWIGFLNEVIGYSVSHISDQAFWCIHFKWYLFCAIMKRVTRNSNQSDPGQHPDRFSFYFSKWLLSSDKHWILHFIILNRAIKTIWKWIAFDVHISVHQWCPSYIFDAMWKIIMISSHCCFSKVSKFYGLIPLTFMMNKSLDSMRFLYFPIDE